MREIKFRAWDDKHKNIINFDLLSLDDGLISNDNCEMFNIDKCELMQFTGLKDKNGKEIYEGDIVESISGSIGEVKYSDKFGCFYWYDEGSCDEDWTIEKLKVIGNKFENPELIMEAKK